jgi:putative intracellular protease/amidase
MSKKTAGKKEQELDAQGLVVQKYVSTVLVLVPRSGFAETTLRYARSALSNVHVGTRCVATDDQAMSFGELQDELQADERLSPALGLASFSGLILCAGPGVNELLDHPDVLRLAREAAAQEKLLAAWGNSVAILAKAGVLRGVRVTGDPALRETLVASGARYTGTQVQIDGKIVSAFDDAAGLRFGKALAQIVSI